MNLKAFTLIETMVAVTLLTFAVAGPLTAADRGLVAATTAKDQLTASYLAQEGIESTRLIRDNDYLNEYEAKIANPNSSTDVATAAWTDFLSDVGNCGRANSNNYCQVDPLGTMTFPLPACSGNTCTVLYLTATSGGYYTQSQTTGKASPYTRTVQITDISSTEEKVVSTVSWTDHGVPFHVTITDHLTPWQ